jgi:hypothetical protein
MGVVCKLGGDWPPSLTPALPPFLSEASGEAVTEASEAREPGVCFFKKMNISLRARHWRRRKRRRGRRRRRSSSADANGPILGRYLAVIEPVLGR